MHGYRQPAIIGQPEICKHSSNTQRQEPRLPSKIHLKTPLKHAQATPPLLAAHNRKGEWLPRAVPTHRPPPAPHPNSPAGLRRCRAWPSRRYGGLHTSLAARSAFRSCPQTPAGTPTSPPQAAPRARAATPATSALAPPPPPTPAAHPLQRTPAAIDHASSQCCRFSIANRLEPAAWQCSTCMYSAGPNFPYQEGHISAGGVDRRGA